MHPPDRSGEDRMTARDFVRWFAAHRNRAQLAVVAATLAVGSITAACWPAVTATLPAWARVTAGAVSVVLYLAFVWLMLGSQRVQRWVAGS